MLRLSIAGDGMAAPPVPAPDEPDVETWRDLDGTLIAHAGSRAGHHWLSVAGVGVFTFGDNAAVRGYPDAGVATDLVEDAFRRIVLPLALQALGSDVLHASAVRGGAGVVALCAVSETGKSTVAYGLSRRGYELWADDAVPFTVEPDAVRALPVPFTLRLRPESAVFFGRPQPSVQQGSPGPLAAICLLEREEREERAVGIDRLSAAEAFPAVLSHAYCFRLDDVERKREMLSTYLELVTRVPVLRVRMRTGIELLPRILDELEPALEAATT